MCAGEDGRRGDGCGDLKGLALAGTAEKGVAWECSAEGSLRLLKKTPDPFSLPAAF
jgi:hypothetical protein